MLTLSRMKIKELTIIAFFKSVQSTSFFIIIDLIRKILGEGFLRKLHNIKSNVDKNKNGME